MHPESTTLARSFDFNGRPLTVIDLDSRSMFFAKDVGERLEYADPSRLAQWIAGKWAAEFNEGTDYVMLTGERLDALKANYRTDRAVVVEPNAPQVLLLTESGVQLAAMLSRTDVGRAFRRWLVDTVLPALRKQAEQDRERRTAPTAIEIQHILLRGGPNMAEWRALLRERERVDITARQLEMEKHITLKWATRAREVDQRDIDRTGNHAILQERYKRIERHVRKLRKEVQALRNFHNEAHNSRKVPRYEVPSVVAQYVLDDDVGN